MIADKMRIWVISISRYLKTNTVLRNVGNYSNGYLASNKGGTKSKQQLIYHLFNNILREVDCSRDLEIQYWRHSNIVDTNIVDTNIDIQILWTF